MATPFSIALLFLWGLADNFKDQVVTFVQSLLDAGPTNWNDKYTGLYFLIAFKTSV